ncbi:hypothetical protein BJ165DRAFT_1612078 [Panaeolus papilionaceus]|nr:hypothetical protein BJ165DRAFT_1612078 [Panaeolus papilionaceus]
MKLLSLLACAISVASVAAHCGDPADAVPFYRMRLPSDHFYTANAAENARALASGTAIAERSPGRIFTFQALGTIPLYRFYLFQSTDHHYTANVEEKNRLLVNPSANYEGIAGYIYPDASCGGIPLYRSYNGDPLWDHFFTERASEWDAAVAGGWVKEGIAGYIVPL